MGQSNSLVLLPRAESPPVPRNSRPCELVLQREPAEPRPRVVPVSRSTPITLGQAEDAWGHFVPGSRQLCKTLGPPRRSFSPRTSSPRPTGRDREPPGDRAQWHLAWRGAGSLLAARPSARPAPRSGCRAPSSSSAPTGRRWPSTSAIRRPTTCGNAGGKTAQPEPAAASRAPCRAPPAEHCGAGGFSLRQPRGAWGRGTHTSCTQASAASNDWRGQGHGGIGIPTAACVSAQGHGTGIQGEGQSSPHVVPGWLCAQRQRGAPGPARMVPSRAARSLRTSNILRGWATTGI